MASLPQIKVVRPYSSTDEFIDSDAWTVDRSTIVLVDQDALPAKTTVKFEVALASGEAVVRGEGRVVEVVEPDGGRPGGLRIKLRKLASKSKSVLKRALEAKKRQTTRDAEAQPESIPDATAPRTSESEDTMESAADGVSEEAHSEEEDATADDAAPESSPGGDPSVDAVPDEAAQAIAADGSADPDDAPEPIDVATVRAQSEKSGVRHRPRDPVAPPENRDALLARLRKRAEAVAKATVVDEARESG